MQNLQIQFEIPALLASQAGLNINDISQDVRQMLALFLYEHQRVSLGKACEIGGLTLWQFIDLNRQLEIPLRYSQQDLQEDMQRLARV